MALVSRESYGPADTPSTKSSKASIMFSALNAFRAAVGAGLLAFPSCAALAEDKEDIRIRVGLGGQIRPDYLGSNGTEWAPLWDLSIARGSNPFEFEAPDDSFDIKVYSKSGLSLGPAANIASGRDRSDVGARVDKLATTIEVGGFAQYEVSDSIRLRAEVRRGINGHEGLVASLGQTMSGVTATIMSFQSARACCCPMVNISAPGSEWMTSPRSIRACRPTGLTVASTRSAQPAASSIN